MVQVTLTRTRTPTLTLTLTLALTLTLTLDPWIAVVQVRQKVPHKRTFLWLEQLILRHRAHVDCVNIVEMRDGLDFYFDHRSHAGGPHPTPAPSP